MNLEERTWVTEDAFKRLADEAKLGGPSKQFMWKKFRWSQQADLPIYGSTWWWRVS